MIAPINVVDAFTERQFGGNPAAVVRFERFPDDAVLQAIAAENNLAETAFLEPAGEDWNLRWFTPTNEVPLCGHATLASAWVVLNVVDPGVQSVRFHTRESGTLTVRRETRGFAMDFPAVPAALVSAPADIAVAIGRQPREVWASAAFYMAVLGDADEVRGMAPDFAAIARLDRRGLIVTAPGDRGFDCISRFFAPQDGIPEDPVTGSAHCMLTPYWCGRLGISDISAFQASSRGGALGCGLRGERVELRGECVPYLSGSITFAG